VKQLEKSYKVDLLSCSKKVNIYRGVNLNVVSDPFSEGMALSKKVQLSTKGVLLSIHNLSNNELGVILGSYP